MEYKGRTVGTTIRRLPHVLEGKRQSAYERQRESEEMRWLRSRIKARLGNKKGKEGEVWCVSA